MTSRAPDSHDTFAVTLTNDSGYAQEIMFSDDLPPLLMDEPPPLGDGSGPNPAKLLAAAVGGCLGASLIYCLRRSRIEVHGLRTAVHGTFARNERGRKRIGAIAVRLEPIVAEADSDRVLRCLTLFEDYCVVTASVRQGLDVDVTVLPVATPSPAAVATGNT